MTLPREMAERMRDYQTAQLSVNYWWPNRHFIMVCDRPLAIRRNGAGLLHCENGQALEYRDGWGLWMLNGVRVPKELVMTEPEQLNPKLILTERNAEVRREIVRKIGAERVIQKLGGKTVHKKGDYELLTLSVPGMAIVPTYLKMRNPSIGVWHVEGVPPEIKTVDEALAWRDSEDEYVRPSVLT